MKSPWVLQQKGFTLIELLIVIVIIAILAAITVVAYNGIQQRANNTAIVSGVTQAAKLIRLYKAANDVYPATTYGTNCLTQDNNCASYNGNKVTTSNSDLITSLANFGTLPASLPAISSTYYGAYYSYNTGFTYNNSPNPVLLSFFLVGTNQDCTSLIGGMVSVKDNPVQAKDYINAKSSNNNIGGFTRCYLMFP